MLKSFSESVAEQIFSNQPLLLRVDAGHSQEEARYRALGYTNEGRLLFVVFTIRRNLVRIISARDMNKKERVDYENFKSNS